MRPWAVPLVALALLVAAGCGSAAPVTERGLVRDPADIARTPDDALFTVDCGFSHRSMDDPIVKFRQPGASHSHDFFGNGATDAGSTASSLRGRATTCEDKDDTASYWAPTVSDHGRPVTPTLARAYYRAVVGSDVTRVQAPPAGLQLLAGDAHAMAPQPTAVVGWGCGFRPRRLAVTPPDDCSVNLPLTLELHFPDCWDGRHLASADHRSHAAYSVAGRCPSTHPVAITQVQLTVVLPLWGDDLDVTLASGPVITGHGDFFNTWDQARLDDQVRTCIHAKANCTIG